MGRELEKRRRLFHRFSSQLLLLRANGLIDHEFIYPNPYLCPICLREFSEEHLDEHQYRNFLTAEDAPPAALDGRKIALTCKECNNRCGQQIDNHLVESIRAIDESHFYKGSKLAATIEHEGHEVTIELESLGDGVLQAYHFKKHNDPNLLERFIFGVKNGTIGPVMDIKPPARRADPERINRALLKANYIITFARFGYLFLLDPQYQIIRDQLLNPAEAVYPWTPFKYNVFNPENIGTHYVYNQGIRSILNVFALRTQYSETVIGGFLQAPTLNLPQFAGRVNLLRDARGVVLFDTGTYDPDADLFGDLAEMQRVIRWIYS